MPLTSPATTDPNFLEAYLSYQDASGSTNTIVFDAVLTEDWTQSASVTEHPVESGANVADHVRVELTTCSLKVRVSNEPLDSNQFSDPMGGPGETAALLLHVPTPNQNEFSGFVMVPTWMNNLALSEQIGIVANIGSGIAAHASQTLADATPLGNAFAAGLKPIIRATQLGNEVIAYPDVPQVEIGEVPIRSVGDAVGALVHDAITSLVPAGQEVSVPTMTQAGMPGGNGSSDPVTAQTVQFQPLLPGASPTDFAAKMTMLLVGLKNAAQQFRVVGSKQELTPMVIETLSTRRGAPEDTGTGVEISLTFKEVRLVSTNTVAVPLPKIPRATPPVDAGAQDGVQADPADLSSVALTGADEGAALIGSVLGSGP